MAADGTAKTASGTAIRLGAAERRLLARMPLHAITSVHGEASLHERLLMQIAQFPAADHARAGDALALASRHLQSKTGLGPLQYSRNGSATLPRDGPRRLARSVTTITRRPGRAWYCVRIAPAPSTLISAG